MFDKSFLLEQIKNFVSIRDVFDKYVGTEPDMHGRYQCPFNDSEDRKNFGIKHNKMWHCFSCGTSGDQITLVQKLFDLPFNDAMLKIAEDFNLCTERNEKMSLRMRIETQRRQLQREKDKRYARFIEYESNKLFSTIIGLHRILENIIDKTNPTDLTSKYYMYNNKCKINMEARNRISKLDIYIDILSEVPTSDGYECFDYTDKNELHERAIDLVKQYIKGELKL